MDVAESFVNKTYMKAHVENKLATQTFGDA